MATFATPATAIGGSTFLPYGQAAPAAPTSSSAYGASAAVAKPSGPQYFAYGQVPIANSRENSSASMP